LAVGGKIERDLTVDQLRERLGSELRRFMAPVALPTPIAQNEESDADMESRLRETSPRHSQEANPGSEPLP
jgi:hypothetical protein